MCRQNGAEECQRMEIAAVIVAIVVKQRSAAQSNNARAELLT